MLRQHTSPQPMRKALRPHRGQRACAATGDRGREPCRSGRSARLRPMRWVVVIGLLGLAACASGSGGPREERALPERIVVTSPAFAAGTAIPRRFTCEGENVSPPLAWSGVAAGTAEVALVVDDPDAPRGTYVHWVVTGLDPAARGRLAEGGGPAGARPGAQKGGVGPWGGP